MNRLPYITLVILGLSLLLLPGWIQPSATFAQTEEDPYWDLVTRSRERFSQTDLSAEDIQQLRREWEAIQYAPYDGLSVRVDPTAVINRLDESIDRIEEGETPPDLASYFAAIEATWRTWPDVADDNRPSTTAAFAELDQILADERYGERAAEPLVDLDALVERLLNWLNRLFSSDREMPELTPTAQTGSGIAIIMSIVTGFLLLFVMFNLLRGASFGWRRDGKSLLLSSAEQLDDPITSEEALEGATRQAEAGDYRQAVRYLYLSTLLTLEEKHLLRYDKSMTNREYIRSVKRHPKIAGLLRDVVNVFDRVWYGGQEIDPDTFAHYREQIDQLKQVDQPADADKEGQA